MQPTSKAVDIVHGWLALTLNSKGQRLGLRLDGFYAAVGRHVDTTAQFIFSFYKLLLFDFTSKCERVILTSWQK